MTREMSWKIVFDSPSDGKVFLDGTQLTGIRAVSLVACANDFTRLTLDVYARQLEISGIATEDNPIVVNKIISV